MKQKCFLVLRQRAPQNSPQHPKQDAVVCAQYPRHRTYPTASSVGYCVVLYNTLTLTECCGAACSTKIGYTRHYQGGVLRIPNTFIHLNKNIWWPAAPVARFRVTLHNSFISKMSWYRRRGGLRKTVATPAKSTFPKKSHPLTRYTKLYSWTTNLSPWVRKTL